MIVVCHNKYFPSFSVSRIESLVVDRRHSASNEAQTLGESVSAVMFHIKLSSCVALTLISVLTAPCYDVS